MAYRALYSTGDLSYGGQETGVIYGLFRDILNLQDLHAASAVAWCFDRGHDKRKEIDPQYKKRDWKDTPLESAERESRRAIRRQLFQIRTQYLPKIGYRNVFWQDGYEADDVVASVCKHLPQGWEGMVVSRDADLYQLLEEDRITMWNVYKQRPITEAWLRAEYGVGPGQWAMVKAIAGCPGDNVIGIKGVGEKTAAKFLRGKLKSESKAWKAIQAEPEVREHNIRLTQLPFDGTRAFHIQPDELSQDCWEQVAVCLGMKSLRERAIGIRSR